MSKMQTYIRVVADSPTDGADDLRNVLDDLISTLPATSECDPMLPHPKGGFRIFLQFPDDEIQTVLEFLTSNGWMPCF
ncbi:hypothetical protein N9N28_01425 [Rubripirellula amarantea]|nr:hypothetical protein [Rubripirellula amarantea]